MFGANLKLAGLLRMQLNIFRKFRRPKCIAIEWIEHVKTENLVYPYSPENQVVGANHN